LSGNCAEIAVFTTKNLTINYSVNFQNIVIKIYVVDWLLKNYSALFHANFL